MSKLRVLVADGSATYMSMFSRAATELGAGAGLVCAATAARALDAAQHGAFDLIVVDAEIHEDLSSFIAGIYRALPQTRMLITARPSIPASDAKNAAARLEAVDFMSKPIHSSYNENYETVKQKLGKILEDIERAGSKRAPRAQEDCECAEKEPGKDGFRAEIVLIAASTGGPVALERVVSRLDGSFPAPILVVQHMLPQFTETLAQNLDQQSPLRVKVAEDREKALPGTVYIARGGVHMTLGAGNTLLMDDSPPVNEVKPAADVLFESVAANFRGSGVLAVILTGMGRDGARGLLRLKERRRCYCIAQSEKTCVVYGMPRAVVENGCADIIADLDDIHCEIKSFDY